MKQVAVLGASGMLGRELRRQLKERGFAPLALDLPELDLTDAAAVAAHAGLRGCDTLFNCAAYTNVEKAEAEEALAMRVNAGSVANLAGLARGTGALLLHVSTDFVFDGKARTPYPVDAPCAPLSAYGRSKLAGENALREAGCRHCLVRTAWLYGAGGKNFVETMLRLAAETERLAVVDDQTGSPTFTADLAGTLLDLAEAGAAGTFHCTGSGSCTWREFAVEILEQSGYANPVEPLTSAEAAAKFSLKAERPAYSVLELSKLEQTLGRPLRPWREALACYLAAREE